MVDATLSPLDRGTIRTDVNRILEGFTLATATDPNPDAFVGEGPVYNLVIDQPAATILWDTGSHPDAGDGHWPAGLYEAFEHADADDRTLDVALEDAGYAIDDIDAVIQSHLHMDHAGGLRHFAGKDVPVFVHEQELKHAYYSARTDEGSETYVLDDFDHDLNWQVIHGESATHFGDVEFVHLPGHTPGLLGLQIDLDDRGTVLLAGDEAYVRKNYEDEVPLGAGLCWSKRDWFDSLRELQDRQRRHDATVICGHDETDFERLRDEF
ncbi:MAG: N-acyl homoserine lactonase family protein [Halopenitus sp.]